MNKHGMPTNAQYDSQLEMLARLVEATAQTGAEAAEIIRSLKTSEVGRNKRVNPEPESTESD